MATRYTKEGLKRAERVRRFFTKYLHLVDDRWYGKPFILADWQFDNIVKPIFGTLYKGKRKYNEALIGLPRKHAKSTIMAGLALYFAVAEQVMGQQILIVASNKQQAGIIFAAIKKMIALDPVLYQLTKGSVFRDIVEFPALGASIKVLPYSEAAAQGWFPRIAIIDEYHVHKNDEMRNAMLSGMAGREEPLLITITTAGKEHNGPLYDLLQTIDNDPSAYKWWAGAPDSADGHDPKVWRKFTLADWITDDYLLSQYRKMPFSMFERYHLNRFPTEGQERAFDPQKVQALSGKPVRFDPDLPVVIGLDASFKRDTTAVVADQFQPDGTHIWQAWFFKADADRKLGHIDHLAVEGLLRELWREYNVTRIACDPNYFVRSMSELYDEGLPIEEFPQTQKMMTTTSMHLFDVILEGRASTGNNAELEHHLMNAGIQTSGYGWRLTKVRDDLKIDGAVACAIATYLAEGDRQESVSVGALVV